MNSPIAFLLYSLLALASMMTILMASVLLWLNKGLPNLDEIAQFQPAYSSKFYDRNGILIDQLGEKNRHFVPYSAIPPSLIHAFITAEDRNFFTHKGLDFLGITRAMLHNIFSDGRKQGASTITQQLARNMFLTHERTLTRKLKEILLAIRIERHFSKEWILEHYLNYIYLGANAYGIAAAAETYFNTPYSDLSLAQNALLAALPKAPSAFNPYNNPKRAKERRDWIIRSMAQLHYVSYKDADDALLTNIELASPLITSTKPNSYITSEVHKYTQKQIDDYNILQDGLTIKTTIDHRLQSLAEDALRHGLINYSKRQGFHGVLGSATDFESPAQAFAQLALPPGAEIFTPAIITDIDDTQQSLTFHLQDNRFVQSAYSNNRWIWENHPLAKQQSLSVHDFLQVGDIILLEEDNAQYRITQLPKIEGAIVVLNPHNGDVLALQGGFSFARNEFNRATQAKRQPGSAIKPFIYLKALEENYPPTYLIDDEPIEADDLSEHDQAWKSFLLSPNASRQTDDFWSPQNASGFYYGSTTLRQALEKSYNVATVRLALRLGLPSISELFTRLGLYTNHTSLPLSSTLGSEEIDLLSLTAAYGIIANGGHAITPNFIQTITDHRGKILLSTMPHCNGCNDPTNDPVTLLQAATTKDQLIDARSAYQLSSILQGATQHGTAKRARTLPFDVAGKTGTTNQSKDAWFIGYTDKLVVGVYTGFDIPQSLGYAEQGASVALPIFMDFIQNANSLYPAKALPIPEGLQIMELQNTTTGHTQREIFKSGNLPNLTPSTSSHPPSLQGTGGVY